MSDTKRFRNREIGKENRMTHKMTHASSHAVITEIIAVLAINF